MKNAPTETMIQASDAIAAGSTIAAVQKAFGLNYSQLWLFHTDRFMDPSERMDPTSATFKTELAKARGFVRIPGGTGFKRNLALPEQSWGLIAVRSGLPESRCRKLFREYTNVDDAGLRIGKGGRFLADDETFYRGTRPDDGKRVKAGTDFVKGAAGRAEYVAPDQEPKAPKARKPRTTKAAKAEKLRAKAASTTFPAEAEAFNAKADQLEAEAS